MINNKTSSLVISKINEFIIKNGAPDMILTDNGGEFISKEFKKYCKKKTLN